MEICESWVGGFDIPAWHLATNSSPVASLQFPCHLAVLKCHPRAASNTNSCPHHLKQQWQSTRHKLCQLRCWGQYSWLRRKCCIIVIVLRTSLAAIHHRI